MLAHCNLRMVAYVCDLKMVSTHSMLPIVIFACILSSRITPAVLSMTAYMQNASLAAMIIA